MIPTDWTSVASTNVAAIKYDAAERKLFVRFHSGSEYEYSDVPPEEAESLFHASSPGSYFRSSIMGQYDERRVV